MVSNLIPRGALAALAGATLTVTASSAPAVAFTLSSPSIAAPVTTADVEHVWWDRWGYWHPNRPWGWRRWGWGPPPPRFYGFHGPYGYYGPVRHCWRGPWGGLHCRWG